MQRVSSFLPSWDRRRSSGSKGAPGGLFGWSNRSSTSSANGPLKLAVAGAARVHREAFWPATLDQECDKAARILKSFCGDGYLAPLDHEPRPPSAAGEPTTPVKIVKKIPRRVLQNAAGIAVFTCMRSGLWMTGSGGSGILIARKSDGTWSPPSGIMLHTPTLSFIIGVDVYDCVLVVNNLAALESMTKPRVTLGEDVGLAAGPLVPLDSDEAQIRWQDTGNTVLTYLKARGQHQNVNLNGCILAERANENERFYSSSVTQMDVLAGNVRRHVEETRPLSEVIKMAEGRTDFDPAVIAQISAQTAPGDATIVSPKSTPVSPHNAFGIPKADDPDPFGVLALEMAGLEIREAGTKLRPASSQFGLNSHPSSPTTSKFSRQSVDTFVSKSNRGSYMSTRTVKSQMTDTGTQTDLANTPETTPSPGQSEVGHGRVSFEQMPLANEVVEEEVEEEVDYTEVDLTPLKEISGPSSIHSATSEDKNKLHAASGDDRDKVTEASSNYENDSESDDTNDADDEDDIDEEEPVVFEIAAVQPARTQVVTSRVLQAKGSMVTIPKRIPPPLPARSPARISRSSKSEIGDVSGLRSPLRQEFGDADLEVDGGAARESALARIEDGQPPEGAEEVVSPLSVLIHEPEDFGHISPEDEQEVSPLSVVIHEPEEEISGDRGVEPEVSPSSAPIREPEEHNQEVPVEPEVLPMSGPEPETASEQVLEENSNNSATALTDATEHRTSTDLSTTPTTDQPYPAVEDTEADDTPKTISLEAEAKTDAKTDAKTAEADDGSADVDVSKEADLATVTAAA